MEIYLVAYNLLVLNIDRKLKRNIFNIYGITRGNNKVVQHNLCLAISKTHHWMDYTFTLSSVFTYDWKCEMVFFAYEVNIIEWLVDQVTCRFDVQRGITYRGWRRHNPPFRNRVDPIPPECNTGTSNKPIQHLQWQHTFDHDARDKRTSPWPYQHRWRTRLYHLFAQSRRILPHDCCT